MAISTQDINYSIRGMTINTQDTNYSTGGIAINTQDTNYSTGDLAIHTQDTNYSTGGMAIHTQDTNYSTGGMSINTQNTIYSNRDKLTVYKRTVKGQTCTALFVKYTVISSEKMAMFLGICYLTVSNIREENSDTPTTPSPSRSAHRIISSS